MRLKCRCVPMIVLPNMRHLVRLMGAHPKYSIHVLRMARYYRSYSSVPSTWIFWLCMSPCSLYRNCTSDSTEKMLGYYSSSPEANPVLRIFSMATGE